MDGLDDLMAAFAGVNVDDHGELVEKFAQVLGADADSARFFLEASSWNLEGAVCTFLDTVGSRVRVYSPDQPLPLAPLPPPPPPAALCSASRTAATSVEPAGTRQ